MKPRIIVESKIPFIRGLMEPWAEVQYLAPEEITANAVRVAEALVIRTRTRCDASLLKGSRVQLIATATIGTDHIDLPYCQSRGIAVANAPGCNAPAVAQYVFAAIDRWIKVVKPGIAPSELTLGVVGVGHVGSIVEQWGRAMGMTVMLCDPPRQEAEGSDRFTTIEEIARQSDIITFHTPMTPQGSPYATWHLADDSLIATATRKPLLINAARGPVTDTAALIRGLDSGSLSAVAIDCWEGEPAISTELLKRALVATPHIAGYSLEGKKRATAMALEAVSRHFGWPAINIADPAPAGWAGAPTLEQIAASYSPEADTEALSNGGPEAFEALRNGYSYRSEVR